MNCRQIGQYALICNNTDWYFDNDDNGMSYFIYKPTETKYSMVVAPQSCCCGCEAEPQIKFGVNAQVIQSTVDEKEAQEWLNNLVNNNFMGMIAVPTYIKQYEAVRKYLNARESSRFTESDLHYLEENMYKAYHITEQSFKNYVDYYTENFEEKEEFANVDRFVEGFVNTAAQFLAGKNGNTGIAATGLLSGVLAMLPMITKVIPIPGLAQIVQGGLFVAKVLAGIKMAQASEKYLKAKDKKEKALIISTAVSSQVLQCFAAWGGSKLLQNAVQKIAAFVSKFAVGKSQGEKTIAETDKVGANAGLKQDDMAKIHDATPEEAAKIAKEAGASDEVAQNIAKCRQNEDTALKNMQAEAKTAETQAAQAETQNAAEIQQANQVAATANQSQQAQQAPVANQQTQVPATQPAVNQQQAQVAAPAQTPAPQTAPQQTAQVATNTQQQAAAQPAQQSSVMAFRNGKPISQLSNAEKEQMQAEAEALTGSSQQAQAVPIQGTANQLQATPITDDPERQARLDAIRSHNASLQAQAQPTLSNRDMRKMMRQNAKAVKNATA